MALVGLLAWVMGAFVPDEACAEEFPDPVYFFSGSFLPFCHGDWDFLPVDDAAVDVLAESSSVLGDGSFGVELPFG